MFSVGVSQYTFHKALCAKRTFDWTRVNIMLVDEKLNTPKDHPSTCASQLLVYFKEANTPYKNAYFINSEAEDPEAECERFARIVNEHEPDLAFIGIGINGHIALNEPDEGKFDDLVDCKVVKISDRTKQTSVDAGYFKSIDEYPTDYGITLTLPRISKLKRKFTIMPYPEKADAAYEAFCGEIRESLPATYARMFDWVVFMDKDSSSRIPE